MAAARKTLTDLETQQAQRPSRSVVLALESKARDQLQQTNAEPAASAGAGIARARGGAHDGPAARRRPSWRPKSARYEEQALGYGARGELLRARHDQAARDLDDARALAARWQQAVLDKQREEAGAAAQAAAAGGRPGAPAAPTRRPSATSSSP